MSTQGGNNFIRFFSRQGRHYYDLFAVPKELNAKYFTEQQYIFRTEENELLRGKILYTPETRTDGVMISPERDFHSAGNNSLFAGKEVIVTYVLDRLKLDRSAITTRLTVSFDRAAGTEGTDDYDMHIVTEQCAAYAPFHVIDRFRLRRKAHAKVSLPAFMA